MEKSRFNNNKFKISALTWNYKFDLPATSYSITQTHDYFEYIVRNCESMTDNPSIQIYINRIKNRIGVKIMTGYKLELLSHETSNLLENAEQDIDKDKDREHIPKIESVVSMHYNLVNNSYQQASKGLDIDKDKDRKHILKPQSVFLAHIIICLITFIKISIAECLI